MKERVEYAPLTKTHQPWRRRRRLERWIRENPQTSGVTMYGRYPPYGRMSMVGPAWVAMSAVYKRRGRRMNLITEVETSSLDWHVSVRVAEIDPGTYDIWMLGGSKFRKRASVQLKPGDLYVIYIVAKHIGLIRRLFTRERTTRVFHGKANDVVRS